MLSRFIITVYLLTISLMHNIFSNFVNLYSLTKTLRFKLKPYGKTKDFLEAKIKEGKSPIEIDTEIDTLYKTEMKPMLDKLHLMFIESSLQYAKFDTLVLVEIFRLYKKEQELKKNRKGHKSDIDQIEKEVEKLMEEIRKSFNNFYSLAANEWLGRYNVNSNKTKGYELLTSEKALDLLVKIFPEKSEIIKKFKGFWTYFSGFNLNRGNYYSSEAKATSIANRAINENFLKFLYNKDRFEIIISKVSALKEFEINFKFEEYAKLLTQNAIDIFNEKVIGVINSKTNEYNQKVDKKNKLPKLKTLFKQIGSEKKASIIKEIKKGEEINALKELIENQSQTSKDILKHILNFFENISDYDLENIYINKAGLTELSNKYFSGWKFLTDQFIKSKFIKKNSKEEEIRLKDFSLADLKISFDLIAESPEDIFKAQCLTNINTSKSNWEIFIEVLKNGIKEIFFGNENFVGIEKAEEKAKELIERGKFEKGKKIEGKETDSSIIKTLCDSYLSLNRFVKNFKAKDREGQEEFYGLVDSYLEDRTLIQTYNAFRNLISAKPFSTDKIKLNFENGMLVGGWSDGQEMNKSGVILRNGNKLFLGILKKRNIFKSSDSKNPIYKTNSNNWQRLILKSLKYQTLAGKGFLGKFGESYGTVGKRDPFEAMDKLKLFINENYLDKYPLLQELIETHFESKKAFDKRAQEILNESFSMNFVNIAENILLQNIEWGDLYLFEITNRDYSKVKDSKDNIHTLYFKELFSDLNTNKPQLVLNGGAELFWRKAQKEFLNLKKDKKGKEIYDSKRYAEDKFFFHFPITINYGKPKIIKFKDLVTQIENHTEIKFLGLDRGEKHLIYYSLINSNGEIIKQGSFNTINGFDYNKKLTERAKEMMEGRKNWEEIGTIKNFKEGYLSQVIHEIYDIVIKHNALIIIENLNSEFKAKRTAKVEKAVYKKFEIALAKKLNHLVLKERKPEEEGGVLKAYQLTPYIKPGEMSYFENSSEWGIIKKVRAAYTSTTDPLTGWRKHIYIGYASTIEKIKEEFAKNSNDKEKIKISYNSERDTYVFSYTEDGIVWKLEVYKSLNRFKWDNQKKTNEAVNLYAECEKLFAKYNKETVLNEEIFKDSNFDWKKLGFIWQYLNQIRNTDRTKEGDENDFIQSPVFSEKINDFFDSRKAKEYEAKFGLKLPNNGDANGAYHIALGGFKDIKER